MITADQRVTMAAEFLAGARKRKVAELPPSLLIREVAELRRQLGQVLDVAGHAIALDDGQREVLAQALADALDYRDLRVNSGQCHDCEEHPAALCEDHAADLELTDAYLALADELGIEVTR